MRVLPLSPQQEQHKPFCLRLVPFFWGPTRHYMSIECQTAHAAPQPSIQTQGVKV